jgi:pilus assembly protein Flp/PilA
LERDVHVEIRPEKGRTKTRRNTLNLINDMMARLMIRLTTPREEGQTMVEYGLIVALISIAAIGTIVAIGPQLIIVFQKVVNGLQGVTS